ncbi:MAG: xanthine dehydrogenase small subunit [Betaproteobacteria bacterium]
MADPIRFLLNGNLVEAAGVSPQTTLLEYLRDHRRLTGTKEGCAEGDCGACTVVVAEPAAAGGLEYHPINACIRLLPTIDGKAVFTVEALAAGDTLHPVQEAMVREHGSQCGFCTPGFVMSLFGLYKNAHRPPRADVMDALSGNLCRCTGYRPILSAADAMYSLLAPADWRGPGIAADGARRISPDEEALATELAALARDGTFEYEHAGQRFFAPRTHDELARLVAALPDARIVAGTTDVGLWVTKQHRALGNLIYVGNVDGLAAIGDTDGALEIGAAATLAAAFAALDAEWPELHEAWERFASVPIRNAGTLGGNVANGSPIGDSMPALIALGATVVLRRGAASRELPLEDFYVAYQQTAREAGEYVAAIRVPRRRPATTLRAYKLSRRHDQDISAVFACFRFDLDAGRIASARIGVGGVAVTPKRASATEAALTGRPWTEPTARTAMVALTAEFSPITDMRATADYRRDGLAALLLRCWHETGTDAPRVPTRVADVIA